MTRPITAIAADLVEAWDAFGDEHNPDGWTTLEDKLEARWSELRDALAHQPTTTRDRLAELVEWASERIYPGDSYTVDDYRADLEGLAAAPDLSRDAEVARLREALGYQADRLCVTFRGHTPPICETHWSEWPIGVDSCEWRQTAHAALEAPTTPAEDAEPIDRWGDEGPCGYTYPDRGTPCLIERYKHPNVVAIGHRWKVKHVTPAEDAGSHAEPPECPRCDDRSAAVAAGILCSQCGGSKEMWCDHIEPEPAR